MSVRFSRLVIRENWQQFSHIDIKFDKQVTILTGANGSGKSTLLNTLATHFNWNINNIATPRRSRGSSLIGWFAGLRKYHQDQGNVRIGHLHYTDGSGADLIVPPQVGGAQYMANFVSPQHVDGFYIPSHRTLFRYEQPTSLPLSADNYSKGNAFSGVTNSDRERFINNNAGRRANAHIKEILLGWSIFGHGNNTMEPNPEFLRYYQEFEVVLKKLLPPKIGFNNLVIRQNEVLLATETGEFLIDSLSGGLTAIVDIAWKMYMYNDQDHKNFTVLIDEIENHLHPEMQRTILNDLASAFPNVQFIVSTHSPLVVNSYKNSSVYVLKYVHNKIHSTRIDINEDAKSANQILDEVLGVSFSMPVWAEESLERITMEFTEAEPTKENLAKMTKALDQSGLGELMPQAIQKIAENDHDKNN